MISFTMSFWIWKKSWGSPWRRVPTVNVGYEVLSELPKERHESPMLSLDKTKERSRLKEFLGSHKAVISWKMDGLTIVLTYRNGQLYQGSHPRQRGGGRSHHQQCQGVSECTADHSLSGRTGAARRSGDQLQRL